MPPAQSSQRDVYTVSRLNAEARAVLEGSFPLLWVEGEISNLATPRSGHLYFSLKDAQAQVRCALFRGKRQLLRFAPADGDQVVARARIGFYEPRGDFQLLIEHLEPAGAGSAQRAFEALKAKLQAEGLFDSARKRDLPTFPRRIGVITSPSGAAVRDVLQVLARRAPHIAVTIFPTRVQGADAPDELVEALDTALRRADCDVLLLTRGGGSVEDLAAFNDERLARRISAATIPIVSAVGHEIDVTIADFVADRRAPTPSAAAELISPDAAALNQAVDRLDERLRNALRRRLERGRDDVTKLSGRLQRQSPAAWLRQQQQRLDDIDARLARGLRGALERRRERVDVVRRRLHAQSPGRRVALLAQRVAGLPARLQTAMRSALGGRRERLAAVARELHAVSPLATLQRGYSVLRRAQSQQVIDSVTEITPGDRLQALLADGRAELTATGIEVVELKPPGD
ncbi:MAG: exodeoxyribonuclease VII large subunit [Gammaproteobacteria bacterium]|nr:exodeoxyribonuclease VII large subunit [Gammaproteobacteria bacterium]